MPRCSDRKMARFMRMALRLIMRDMSSKMPRSDHMRKIIQQPGTRKAQRSAPVCKSACVHLVGEQVSTIVCPA